MTLQLGIALIIAIGAAVRGNWSPCGESLQAQIHPLGEQSRGNTWAVTVGAFTIASALAGGIVTGLMGWVGSIWTFDTTTALMATGLLGLVAGALDLSPLKPPTPRRQVNENWIGRYRGWVYGAAFGVQLGVGFSVFVMSWGYYAMLLAAALTGSLAAGFLIGCVFGLGRGLLLHLAGRIDQPDKLAKFHMRMAALKRPVFQATGVAMLVAGGLALI